MTNMSRANSLIALLVLSTLAIVTIVLKGCSSGGGGNSGSSSGGSNGFGDTEATFAYHSQLVRTAMNHFLVDAQNIGEQAARQVLIDRLQSDSIVKSATLCADGVTIEVSFTTGTHGYLLTQDSYPSAKIKESNRSTQITGSPTIPPSLYPQQDMKPLPKVFIIEPYRRAYKEIDEVYPGLYNAEIAYQEMVKAFEATGYKLVLKENTDFNSGQVTLEDFKDWSEYCLVIVDSHASKDPATVGTGILISTAVEFNLVSGSEDMVPFITRDDSSWTYGLRPSYFPDFAAKMSGALVILKSCNSWQPQWVEAFRGAGAKAFVGFRDTITWDGSARACNYLMDGLVGKYSLENAVATVATIFPNYGLSAGPTDGLCWYLCGNSGGSGECFNIAGDWNVSSTSTLIYTIDGVTMAETQTGNVIMTITQDGCKITITKQYPSPGSPVEEGIIEQNKITTSGILIIGGIESGLTLDENTHSSEGTIFCGGKITTHGSGKASGILVDSKGAHLFSCTATDTVDFTPYSYSPSCVSEANMNMKSGNLSASHLSNHLPVPATIFPLARSN